MHVAGSFMIASTSLFRMQAATEKMRFHADASPETATAGLGILSVTAIAKTAIRRPELWAEAQVATLLQFQQIGSEQESIPNQVNGASY